MDIRAPSRSGRPTIAVLGTLCHQHEPDWYAPDRNPCSICSQSDFRMEKPFELASITCTGENVRKVAIPHVHRI